MADETVDTNIDPDIADDVVLTEEGALPREIWEARQAAGTAAPEVPTETLLERRRAELVRETADAPLLTGFERAVSAGTFGLSDLLAGEERRLEMRRRIEANPLAATTGTIAGAVLPGLVSGGTGTVSTLARLTPAGRLAAVAGRIAARGSTTGGRIATGAAAGLLEGAAQGVGDFLARESLSENPDFSAESLLSSAGLGGILGGALGGAAPALGALGRGAVQRFRGRRAQPLGDLAVDEARIARELEGAAPTKAGRDTVSFEDLVSRHARENTGETLNDLLVHIDDTAQRATTAQADDIATVVARMDELGLGREVRDELLGSLQAAADDFQVASARATLWANRAVRDMGIDAGKATSSKAAAKALPESFDNLGADILAEMDETAQRYALASDAVQSALDDGAAAAAQAVQATPGLLNRVGERVTGITGAVKTAWAKRSSVDALASAVGAAELARDAGVEGLPSVRDIPTFGKALSLWARWKAGSNALRKVGVLPASKATRAAAAVNQSRSRLQTFVDRAARGAVMKATSPFARDLAQRSARAVAQEIANVRGRDTPTVASEATAAIMAHAPDMAATAGATAARAHEYLLSQAPRNPLAGTILEENWRPSAVERIEWSTTMAAVQDPVGAIQSSLTSPYPDRAIAAVEAVYPAMFAEMQQRITLEADRLRRRLPVGRLQALGRVFRVPLTVTQQPGYTPVFSAPEPPGGRMSSPRASTTSPLGTLEQTAEQARARG